MVGGVKTMVLEGGGGGGGGSNGGGAVVVTPVYWDSSTNKQPD